MYDCIIIGAGPAGMSAGIYAKRAGLETLLLDGDAPGGLLNKVTIVDNYLGIKSISGPDLAFQMYEHIKSEEVPFKFEKVLNIEVFPDKKIVTTTKDKYTTKTVIIAIGRKVRKTNLPSEIKFNGKGISYCAICDAPLYKDKKLVVVGGGNSAFEESLYLSKYSNDITILVRSEIIADEDLVEDVKSKGIKILTGVNVVEFLGGDHLTSVMLSNNQILECEGAFIYIGYEAETAFLKNLNITNEQGYIEVNSQMETKVKGVFACGDIIKKDLYQIITAASEGAEAAIAAGKEIKTK